MKMENYNVDIDNESNLIAWDDNDDVVLFEEYDFASNMPCDTYGLCSGSTCPMFYKCHS